MADETKTENQSFDAQLNIQADPKYMPAFWDVLNNAEYFSRERDRGIVNKKTGSSVLIRDNGDISLSAGLYSNQKVGIDGRIKSISLQNDIATNRLNIDTDDFVVNHHKLNPALWEMAELRTVLESNGKYVAGNLTMMGSVLVKAWDAQLKRNVLIRRPVRMPLFYPIMDTEKIPKALHVEDSTSNSGSGVKAYSATDSSYNQSSLAKNGTTTAGVSTTSSKTKIGSNWTSSSSSLKAGASDETKNETTEAKTLTITKTAAITAIADAVNTKATNTVKKIDPTATSVSIIDAAKVTADKNATLDSTAAAAMSEGEKVISAVLDKMTEDKVKEILKQNSNRDPADAQAIAEAVARNMQKAYEDKAMQGIIKTAVVYAQTAIDDAIDTAVKEQLVVDMEKELGIRGLNTAYINPIKFKTMELTLKANIEKQIREELNINLADQHLLQNLLFGTTGLDKSIKNTTDSAVDKLTNNKLVGLVLPPKAQEALNSRLKAITNDATNKMEEHWTNSIEGSATGQATTEKIVAAQDRFSQIEKNALAKVQEAQALVLRWQNTINDWVAKEQEAVKAKISEWITSIKW